MNYAIIRNILGKLMIFIAGLLVLPLIVSIIYKEGLRFYLAFIIPIVLLFLDRKALKMVDYPLLFTFVFFFIMSFFYSSKI